MPEDLEILVEGRHLPIGASGGVRRDVPLMAKLNSLYPSQQ